MKPKASGFDPDTLIDGQDLVYEASRWERMKWRDFLGPDRPLDCRPQGWPEVEQGLARRSADGHALAREVFARLDSEFTTPVEPGRPGAEWAQALHTALDGLPDFGRLAQEVRGDTLLAGLATVALTKQVLEAVPEPPEDQGQAPSVQDAQALLEALRDAGADQDVLDKAEAAAQQAAERAAELVPDPDQARIAARQAVAAARQAMDQAANAQGMLGMMPGRGTGQDRRMGGTADRLRLVQRAAGSAKLREVAAMAGRLTAIALRKQRQRSRTGRTEAYDVRRSDRLHDMVPSELLRAVIPGQAAGFRLEVAEGSVLTYRYRGTQEVGRGPVIVAVDNSGSMGARMAGGTAEAWAKGLALALREIARQQGRDFALLHFDTIVKREYQWPKGEADPAQVLDAMEYFSGGGTEYEAVLRRAGTMIEGSKWDKADVILVTDGFCSVSDVFKAYWQNLRQQRGFSMYGIVVVQGITSEAAERSVLGTLCEPGGVFGMADVMNDEAATDKVLSI